MAAAVRVVCWSVDATICSHLNRHVPRTCPPRRAPRNTERSLSVVIVIPALEVSQQSPNWQKEGLGECCKIMTESGIFYFAVFCWKIPVLCRCYMVKHNTRSQMVLNGDHLPRIHEVGIVTPSQTPPILIDWLIDRFRKWERLSVRKIIISFRWNYSAITTTFYKDAVSPGDMLLFYLTRLVVGRQWY